MENFFKKTGETAKKVAKKAFGIGALSAIPFISAQAQEFKNTIPEINPVSVPNSLDTSNSIGIAQQPETIIYQPEKKKIEPIIVHDKNDPRLRAYNDSLNLYKAYQFQKNNYKPGYEDWLKDVGKDYPGGVEALRKTREKNIGKPLSKEFYDKDSKKSHFKPNIPDSNYDPLYPSEKPVIDYYKSLIGNDKNYRIGVHNSPDLWHKTINPVGSYYDGANSPIYKKPTQPVIYNPKPSEEPINLSILKGNVAESPMQKLPEQKVRIQAGKWQKDPNFPGVERSLDEEDVYRDKEGMFVGSKDGYKLNVVERVKNNPVDMLSQSDQKE